MMNEMKRLNRSGQAKWASLLEIEVDRDSLVPLSRQIYQQLRDAITSQGLPLGSRIPSSRELAERSNVSRTSVVAAYEQLLSEGFIIGRHGSGTFIADAIPLAGPTRHRFAIAAEKPSLRQLSDTGLRYRDLIRETAHVDDKPFSPGRSSIDLPTIEAWRQITARHSKTIPSDVMTYGDTFGRESFREVIAEYLRAFRSVNCTAEQIMITSGAQQAIDLSIRVLLNPGDQVWVEDPGYPATLRALHAANIITIPVPVDDCGMKVDVGLEKEAAPRAIFVTPGHQFPTGAVMSIERRHELLHAGNAADAWILEDDYDSEFRYSGHPLPSLQGLDQSARVIYIGTLSKILFPGLRTGFAVIPIDLIDSYRGARYLTDRGPPIAHQAVLEEFMREGFFTSHIRRMRQRYSATLNEVVQELRHALGDLAEIRSPECGMRFVVYLTQGIDDIEVSRAAAKRGVTVRPISPLYLDSPPRSGLDIGFTGYDQKLLKIAAQRLGDAVREVAGRTLR